MPIDAHQTYKELLEAGVPEPQADAHARIFQSWTEERLVTREYLDSRLKDLARDLKDDYTERHRILRDELRDELREQSRRQMNRMLAVVGVATAIISGLIALFGIFT